MAQNPEGMSLLDAAQIIKRVYNSIDDRLRVDAEVTANISGAQEVIINQVDDSVAIGDGTTLYTGTDVGPKHGLDVNIIAGSVTGEFTPSGLENGLKSYSLVIGDTPTLIPVIPDQNGISIRVWGTNVVYFGHSAVTAAAGANAGYPKRQFEDVSLDIKDSLAVAIYGVCDAGLTSEVRVLAVS